MEILRHKYWDSGERKLQTYPVTNDMRLWEVWRALLQSLRGSNTYMYTETKAPLCFLYVAMGMAAEASVTGKSDAFAIDSSFHTKHIQMDETVHWKQRPGWCWQWNLQRELWRNLFLPHCRWHQDQTWANETYITHVHTEYSNQLLLTVFELRCSDWPVFHASTIVTILLWLWAFPNSAFHTSTTAATDCSGCTKIPQEEAQRCMHTPRSVGSPTWARCPAHGFWERQASRRVWMVLLTPLARGWVRYWEWGAKLFKNPTPDMEPLQCHSHATPLYFVNWLIRRGLPTWNMDRNTLILWVHRHPNQLSLCVLGRADCLA